MVKKPKPKKPGAPLGHRGYNRLYDWETWIKRGTVLLRPGQDFSCAVSSMVTNIRNHASRNKLSVSILEKGRNLIVVFSPRKKAKGA